MTPSCPYCSLQDSLVQNADSIQFFGTFHRRCDSRKIQRFRCLLCRRTFSNATRQSCYRQRKRKVNEPLRRLLCSGVSLRRSAKLLHLSRRTVARKLIFLGLKSREFFDRYSRENLLSCQEVEFDDLETFEHTKLKPLSITLMVQAQSRRILGFTVAQMPAKGLLAALSLKKYGYRADKRQIKRAKLFEALKPLVDERALIRSDQNPHYPILVKRFFPQGVHQSFESRRGCVVGQGELKKIGFDPLFSLNHTCAMLRANINRLFRRTWCTTKKSERLADHIAIYVNYHNEMIDEQLRKKAKSQVS